VLAKEILMRLKKFSATIKFQLSLKIFMEIVVERLNFHQKHLFYKFVRSVRNQKKYNEESEVVGLADQKTSINQLWEKWKTTKDAQVTNQLVEHYLYLVDYHSERIAIHLPKHIQIDELRSLGL